LSELQASQPEVEIETIEILTDPVRALRDGIWMIPAIIIGDQRWYHAPSLAELEAALHIGE
jgi:2-hydroxychromene-2-carboxylate isomerase